MRTGSIADAAGDEDASPCMDISKVLRYDDQIGKLRPTKWHPFCTPKSRLTAECMSPFVFHKVCTHMNNSTCTRNFVSGRAAINIGLEKKSISQWCVKLKAHTHTRARTLTRAHEGAENRINKPPLQLCVCVHTAQAHS